MPDVVLISMPFGPVFAPSIGLSLLKAGLAKHDVPSRIHYFTIRFAEAVGQAFYTGLTDDDHPELTDLVGEWVFAGELFDTSPSDRARYVEEVLTGYSPALVAKILRARDKAGAFLDECVETIVEERPKLVGFTSVFQQHVASLALARRLKQALPATFIVFGGANCEGVMGAETLRSFPFVDAAVSGEGDMIFPEVVKRVLCGQSPAGLPGVRTRQGLTRELAFKQFTQAPMVQEMDSLAVPDYGDYFAQFKASRYEREWQPSVFFETSRGCWWGERQHCTFCGLNGSSMTFRSKSPARVIDELTSLVRQHPESDVQVVDNILDMRYFKDVLPDVAALGLNVSLFYEIKSNLKKDQVRLLGAAGIRHVQPGIESLSDSVLKVMRKGVSGLQNLQLLKWCKQYGVEPSWNFLWGFPGEDPAEYDRMAKLTPLLTHLPAPVSYADIRLDRFSPNFFDADKLGFTDVQPLSTYRHVYPLGDESVANLAYYFTFRYQQPRDVQGYVAPLVVQLKKWKALKDRSDLFSVDVCGRLVLWDLRPVSRTPFTVLSGLDRLLYLECDAATDVRRLAEVAAAGAEPKTPADPADLDARLSRLVAQGVLVRDGSRYLALAIPLDGYVPSSAVVRQFAQLVSRLGSPTKDGWVVPLCERERDSEATGRRRGRGRGPDARPARPPQIRRLTQSQFSIDGRGRLVIQAKAQAGQKEGRG